MVRPRRRGGVALDITNPKIASLAPTWRRHHGVSVLFDNPGTLPAPGVARLDDIQVTDPAAQRLYDELSAIRASLDRRFHVEHGLCALPRSSFHVTVCDGPNERHAIASLAALLDGLPRSLERLPDDLSVLAHTRLLAAVARQPVTFTAGQLVVRGHVLAAALSPAGADDARTVQRISTARDDLVDALWARLRLPSQPWRPHVSLGYFPNRAAARAAGRALPDRLRTLPAGSTSPITFTHAAVYGFTDMASYFRLET